MEYKDHHVIFMDVVEKVANSNEDLAKMSCLAMEARVLPLVC